MSVGSQSTTLESGLLEKLCHFSHSDERTKSESFIKDGLSITDAGLGTKSTTVVPIVLLTFCFK